MTDCAAATSSEALASARVPTNTAIRRKRTRIVTRMIPLRG